MKKTTGFLILIAFILNINANAQIAELKPEILNYEPFIWQSEIPPYAARCVQDMLLQSHDVISLDLAKNEELVLVTRDFTGELSINPVKLDKSQYNYYGIKKQV